MDDGSVVAPITPTSAMGPLDNLETGSVNAVPSERKRGRQPKPAEPLVVVRVDMRNPE